MGNRKRIIIIACLVVAIFVTASMVHASNNVVVVTRSRDITESRALRQAPDLLITSNEILALNNIASAPELEQYIASEAQILLPLDIVYSIVGDMLPRNILAWAEMGTITVSTIGTERTILTLDTEDNIQKTVGIGRNPSADSTLFIYENFNNQSYRVYRPRRLIFFPNTRNR